MSQSCDLTFRYDLSTEAFFLEGAAVANWREDEKRIAHIDLQTLKDLKEGLRGDVQEKWVSGFSNSDYKPHLGYISDVLFDLSMNGRTFWRRLCDDNLDWLPRLRDELTAHMPDGWWLFSPEELSQLVPQIETIGPPEAILPLDILPLGELERISYTADLEDIKLLASYFGGFSSIVRSTTLKAGPKVHPQMTQGGAVLFLRSVTAPGFQGATEVLRIFDRQGWNMLGPFPSAGAYASGVLIAEALVTQTVAPVGAPRIPDLVQIHAHARQGSGLGNALVISFDYGKGEHEFTELRGSHVETILLQAKLLHEDGISRPPGPIVIINACEALGHIGAEDRSVGLELARIGTRVLVGPREEVAGTFAVLFGSAIVANLMKDLTVGEAVVASRWTLLNSHANPTGLLYVSFGDVESRRAQII